MAIETTKRFRITATAASILILLISSAGILTSQAFGMGSAPSTCPNRYDSAISQMSISNGTQTFDPVGNPGVTFRAETHSGYSLSMTLHTANQSTNGNQDGGTTWYSENTFGFGNGHCVSDVGPNDDSAQNFSFTWNYAGSGPPHAQSPLWYTFGGNDVTYGVEWYEKEAAPPPPSTSLQVNSQDANGNTISGYYTVLYQNGGATTTGFTPASFTLNTDQSYTLQVQDYGLYHFAYWLDTGSSNRDRAVSASTSPEVLTAVYCGRICSPPSGQSLISVTTVNSAGAAINGYYTTLWQEGVKLQSCYSPCGFTVSNGQTYQVAVADYGREAFSQWMDGTTNRFHNVDIPSSTTTLRLAAVYSP